MRRCRSDLSCWVSPILAVIAMLAVAAPALAQGQCAVCGSALSDRSVAVTDWETNRDYRYHDLSCAIRDMAARFPWSRAVASSAVSGQRITLTRINGAWRADPEDAVAVILGAPTRGAAQGRSEPPAEICEDVAVFASVAEFREYRDKRKAEMPSSAQPIPLASLPGQLVVAARSGAAPGAPEPQPQPAPAAAQPTPEEQPQVRSAPSQAGPAETFNDVPAGHWAAKSVATVKRLGLLEGYPDGTFRGSQPVTRYELATILARLVEKGAIPTAAPAGSAGASGVGAASHGDAGRPEDRAPTVAPAAGTGAKPAAVPAEAAQGAAPSLLGLSGLMTAPDALTRSAGDVSVIAGAMNNKFLGAANVGIGDGIEVAATTARVAGDNRVFVSAKKRIVQLSRPGLDVAAGVTGLGSDTAGFAAATKQLRLGAIRANVTLGVGTGGLLEGVFGGAAVRLPRKLLPFVRSAEIIAESVDNGVERDLNYGLDLNVNPNLDLKFGSVEGRFAGGLMLGRRF